MPDLTTARIMEAIALQQRGDLESARALFSELWNEIGLAGDALHRCSIAHYMADLQADAQEELSWDLRALEAANSLTDVRVKDVHPSLELNTFYPSLHLNLADDYLRLGETAKALEHFSLAENFLNNLPDAEHGATFRHAIARGVAAASENSLESKGS